MTRRTWARGAGRSSLGRTLAAAAALASSISCFGTVPAAAQTIGTPDVSGDQLIFLYDARTDRVAFLSVANTSDDTVYLDVALYSANLQTELASQTIELTAAANAVIDPTSFAGGGANGSAGLAVITPVVAMDNPTPVVPPQPIVGGFTLANLSLSSGFGQNPFARYAVNSSGTPAAAGTTVDGNTIAYERFDPGILTIPVYFDPATLGPPENDGNRVLIAAFADNYDGSFSVSPVGTTATATFLNNAGERIAQSQVAIDGVLLSDLEAVAGGADLDGASGKVFFQVASNGGNVFGLFSQSVGTFAAGQRMPAAAAVPEGVEPNPNPTPEPTPVVVPTPGGSGGACTVTVSLEFDDASIPDLSGVTVKLSYPSTMEMPGSLSDDAVTSRVTDLTGVQGIFQVFDQDDPNNPPIYLNIGKVAVPGPIPSGPYATAAFACSGAVTADQIPCAIEPSILSGNDVSDQIGCNLSIGN